ncbi:MAG: tRNA (adenosine(37)-N6)-threonylcarbamoyltransferase complex ATPase subunit type 1 TsaE [Phycisphaerales bacterium]|nr:tRNA (adenosine(37)-N6)-threonylcarbamoyltransferase complex ATPase subunit type 1 TsaE [Phycisphaerales bacterium]
MNETDTVYEMRDLADTAVWGRRLGCRLRTGSVVALIGPLGSGKTTLVKSIAAGAGVADPREVNSPTFVLVNEYEARRSGEVLHLYHIDAYRLRGHDDLEALGFEEMCERGAVLIEWADRVLELLPQDRLTMRLDPIGEYQRRFVCQAGGARADVLLNGLASDCLRPAEEDGTAR